MKYRILAHSKDTGRKLTLELEAASKADAERKAKPHNVNIIRIEPADPSASADQKEWTTREPRRAFKFPWTLLLLLIAAAVIYYFWPTLHALLTTLHPPTASRPAPPALE